MKVSKTEILVGLVFLVALALRVFRLGQYPVSMRMDEVAIGYNSFSILKTGTDEWGKFLPLQFRSIGDYKPPVLVYLGTIGVGIFGLNEFGVRIVTAFFGAVTCVVVYLLVKKLLGDWRVALICMLLLAVSAWHTKFSRSTYEAVVGQFFLLGGVYVFVLGKKMRNLYLSVILFALSMYTYHSHRIFAPLLFGTIWVLFGRKEKVYVKGAKKGLIVAGVILLPLLATFLDGGGERVKSTFFIGDIELVMRLTGEWLTDLVVAFQFWVERYLGYFDPNFIFVDAMGMSYERAFDVGLLYLVELPFFVIGVYDLLFGGKVLAGKARAFILSWLLVAPLGASLANNAQHPLRFLTMIPIYQLLSAIGFVYSRRLIRYFGLAFLAINVLYFLNLYFIQYPFAHSEVDMDGWKQAAVYGVAHAGEYEEVVVDPTFGSQGPYTVGTPYLYFLFYGKVEPSEYLGDPRRDGAEWSTNFRNFNFRAIDWTEKKDGDKYKPNVLFIGSEWVLPARQNQIVERFYLYNGKEILRAARVE